MAKPKSVQAYEKEIVKMIEARNGVFDNWLSPQVEGAAMNRVILAQIHTEITKEKSLTISVSGSMGQEKREPHPLLAVYDKMQRTLLQQYAALGLNYNATPSKINEPTGKAAKEDDPLVKFYSGFMDIRDTTPDGEPK
jgi:hypothetical protein